MNVTLLRKFIAHHSQVVENVKKYVIAGLRKRWRQGKAPLSAEHRSLHLRNIDKQLGETRSLFRKVQFPELSRLLDAPVEDLKRGIRLLVKGRQVDYVSRVGAASKELSQSVTYVGLENAGRSIRSTRDHIDTVVKQNERELAEGDWTELLDKAKVARRSPYYRLLHVLHLDGRATRAVEEFLSKEVHYQTGRLILHHFDNEILDRFSSLEECPSLAFTLGEDSQLRRDLEDVYLSAEDDEQAEKALETEIETRLPAILKETLWPKIKAELQFDFDISQSVVESRGCILSTNLTSELSCLLEYLHVDPGHMKLVQWNRPVTEFLMFGVVTRFHNVLAISNMIQREEERCELDDDRRFYARSVEDLYPPRYREQSGVVKDYSVEILAKAFVLSDAVEVYRKRTVEPKIIANFPEGRKTYLSHDSFFSSVTYEEEKFIHDGFWRQFASDRSGTITELDNLVAGRIGAGEKAIRFQAMKNFVGSATLWMTALEKLLARARKVNSYY